jgi:hypothetical protein
MPHLDQLTIRGLDPRLQDKIRELARREGISLNKAAVRLLERGAGIDRQEDSDRIGHSLDHLIGTWSQREADAFLDAIQTCEQIDPDLWK